MEKQIHIGQSPLFLLKNNNNPKKSTHKQIKHTIFLKTRKKTKSPTKQQNQPKNPQNTNIYNNSCKSLYFAIHLPRKSTTIVKVRQPKHNR